MASDDNWGDPISVYDDNDALGDGMIVAVSRRDRCTANLFHSLARSLPETPPNCWPVDLFGWIGAKDGEDRAMAALKGLLGTWEREARRIHEENTEGGILTLWIDRNDEGRILGLTRDEAKLTAAGVRVWLIPNEVGGITAMFPEDY
jgi:hypothetical protein